MGTQVKKIKLSDGSSILLYWHKGDQAMNKKLPKGRELIVLSRQYIDEKYNIDEARGNFNFNLQTMAQQGFFEIIKWLKEKGY